MKRAWGVLFLCIALSSGISFGEKKQSDLKAYLAQVTERGRALYAYDQAAWHGTDAFLALHPDTSSAGKYVCRKVGPNWVVYFGKLNDAKDKYLVSYESTETPQQSTYQAKRLDAPREETGYLVGAVRGIELALQDFAPKDRPYNTGVLPAPNGNLYVYIYPAQVKENVWPLGGDARYTISADGAKIIEKRQLHKTILDMEYAQTGDKKLVSGYHVHVLSDVPEDTDVLYVLNRKPSIPEYVGVQNGQIFVVDVDGTIVIAKK